MGRALYKLDHYHYHPVKKRSGGYRLIEKPKALLKSIQRKILHQIIDEIDAHSASHGFQVGKSILSYVQPHVGKQVVLKMDLSEYFLNIGNAQVRALFHTAGYPPRVSRKLAALCVHHVPKAALPDRMSTQYLEAHLPQGAPTSPALADRIFYRADCRLAGLAKSWGLEYTRYADDLAFSSDDKRFAQRAIVFSHAVSEIAAECGFWMNSRKTRVMPQSRRQVLAGLVINQTPNLMRQEYETLKAILHRCKKNGLEAENRENHQDFYAYLHGRVGFLHMVNPAKGAKLQKSLKLLV